MFFDIETLIRSELLLDLTQVGLDIGGIVDPTGALDAASGLISLGRGDLVGAGISGVGIILPVLGDLAKVGKLGKLVRTMERVVEVAKTDARFAERVRPLMQQLKGALDTLPLDTLPRAMREPIERLKGKVDEFFAATTRRGSTTPPARVVPEQVVDNALRTSFQTRRMQFGEHTFQLDSSGMKHILQRHHPSFWDGSVKTKQSFINSKMSVQEVGDAVEAIMRQNREVLLRKGTNDSYQVFGTYKGQEYTLGISNGRIGQFYPKPN